MTFLFWESRSKVKPKDSLARATYFIFRTELETLASFGSSMIEAFPQEEFLAWIEKVVYVTNYDLKCTKVAVAKQGCVSGFIGTVEFAVDLKVSQNPDFEKLLLALIKLAAYCGMGHKATFGLGQTRQIAKSEVGSGKIKKKAIAATLIQEHLAKRITELTNLFLQTKKRQGGDRPQNSATVWATILARYELSESLKLIVIDLDMPYETVRKYAQTARKVIATLEP